MSIATSMSIRPAQVEDAGNISALINSLAGHFTLHPEGLGAEEFLQSIQPDAIAERIQSKDYAYFVGTIDSYLEGVVAIREGKQLYHLFVSPEHQRRGVAAQLWQYAQQQALASNQVDEFKVNATPYAVPVYERFGFVVAGDRVECKGIAYVPMVLKINNAICDI